MVVAVAVAVAVAVVPWISKAQALSHKALWLLRLHRHEAGLSLKNLRAFREEGRL